VFDLVPAAAGEAAADAGHVDGGARGERNVADAA
jgi:hypothetical protein